MSIATYSELKTAIANWCSRDDLTAVIPDFVRLAEVRIKSMVKVRGDESEVSLVCAAGSAYLNLPFDFKNPVALWMADSREALPQLMPQSMPPDSNPGRPAFWIVDGDRIKFNCAADQNYTLTLRYTQAFELSDSNHCNAILTAYPDVYLFGSLVEAASYLADERGMAWEQRFQSAVQAMNNTETANTKQVTLRVDDISPMLPSNSGWQL